MKPTVPTQETQCTLPSIHAYLDYRQYLGDVFAARKKNEPSFSQREFGRMAGSTSPNFLAQIRSRAINIKPAAVVSVGNALGLAKGEKDYLKTLVAFDHARTHEDKDRQFRKILLKREYSHVTLLDKNQYEFFSHWYLPVIRELATHPAYPGNPLWIAQRIVPPVNVRTVKQGIDLLVSLGLISRTPGKKTWEQTSKVIRTPSEVLSLAVTRYHRDAILLGRDAIPRFQAPDRDIRGVVIGLSRSRYTEVKKRLEAFWRELLDCARDEPSVEQVYQINMQLFPVSGNIPGKRRP